MNEELKKLMIEAGYAAPELAPRAQKLAELLVLKCSELSKYNNYGIDAGRKIKEYFGLD